MISRTSLLAGIEELKESPWYNFGKMDPNTTRHEYMEAMMHYGYLQRKEAVEVIEDICIKKEPAVLADSGWISVKDKLPDDDVSILICSKRKTVSKATYNSDMGRYYIADSDLWYNELDITHWQYLPEPPKGE